VTIGNRIQTARKRAGISQIKLAELIGTDSNTISRWERDIVKMKAEKMVNIAVALNTSVAYLLGEEETNKPLNTTAINNLVANKGTINTNMANRMDLPSPPPVFENIVIIIGDARMEFPKGTSADVIGAAIKSAKEASRISA
jgi:transcriptional regulator with XRE-family HTH domain